VAAEFGKMIELWQIVSKYSTEIRALAKGKRIFFAPEIPQKRLNSALQSYGAIESGERPLVLIDDSLFGGAKIGILLTDQQIYAHEMWKPPLSWPLEETGEVGFERGKNSFINGVKFWKRNSWGKKAACEEFSKLVDEILKVATGLGE
jgi:hypothetical protein